MEKIYEYIVIGASIAGSSFVNNLNNKANILMIDKRDILSCEFKDYKPCGGLISPSAQEELFIQGIAIDDNFLEKEQYITVLNLDFDNNKDIYFTRNYYNIDRQKFDRTLFKKAIDNNGVEFKKEIVKRVNQKDDYIEVVTNIDTYKTKVVVNAQGWDNKFNDLKDMNKYIVVQNLYENNKEINTQVSIFDKEITDYYGWIVPKDNYVLMGVAINKEQGKDYNKLLIAMENKVLAKGYKLGKKIHTEGCQLIRLNSSKKVNMGNEKIINIGEAAGLISPSSAEGYSYALKSGRLVAQGINENRLNLHKIEKKFKRNIKYKLVKKQIMYNKSLRNLVYKTGVFQIEK